MLDWYTARGAGLAAMVLLSVATAGGALQSMRRWAPGTRVVLQYVHRAAAVAGLLVVALHVGTIVADSYANVSVVGAFVPGASQFSRLTVALGTISLYGFCAVAALGAARRSMSRSAHGARLWRSLHLTSYLFWAVAVLHGFSTGTDMRRTWAVALTVACILAVIGAGAARLAEHLRPTPVHLPARSARAATLQVTR